MRPSSAGSDSAMPDDPIPAADEPLWPGGPSPTQVDRWKRRYGAEHIYVTSLTSAHQVVWRALTRMDYRGLVMAMETATEAGVAESDRRVHNERRLVELCVLHPEPAEWAADTPAVGTVAQEIMEASGFTCSEVRQL